MSAFSFSHSVLLALALYVHDLHAGNDHSDPPVLLLSYKENSPSQGSAKPLSTNARPEVPAALASVLTLPCTYQVRGI